MTQISSQFDYSNIDNNTVNFLRLKEEKMREVVGKAYTEIGKELKEAQDELAKCGYGCFESWYVSLGFKKQSVYNYINRYELIVQQLDKRDVIEELPMNLSYEISKPSLEPEIRQQVLDGEITTMKELREVKQQLKTAESTAIHWEKIAKSAQNQPPKVITNTIEIVPVKTQAELADLQFKLKIATKGYQDASEKLKSYENQDTSGFDEEQARLQREKLQHEADMNTLQLRIAYKQFIEKSAVSTFMQGAIATASPTERQRLTELVEIAEKIVQDTKLALKGRKLGVV